MLNIATACCTRSIINKHTYEKENRNRFDRKCFLFYSCYNRKEELLYPNVCNDVSAIWSVDIVPVIKAKFAGCHRAGSTMGPGPLTTYAGIKKCCCCGKVVGGIGLYAKGICTNSSSDPKYQLPG